MIRRPISTIEAEVRRKYGIEGGLLEVAVEKDAFVLTFEGPALASTARRLRPRVKASTEDRVESRPVSPERKRARRRVRNRMKTRGWGVVTKFVNSRRQSCTIYKPILDALRATGAKRRESYTAVRQLLIANGNDPGPSSIEYYLDNHLEYLERSEQDERERAKQP